MLPKEIRECRVFIIEGLVEVQKYCRSHPQKRYILDMNSFMYYRGCVLETRLAGRQNSVYSGGWFSKSPVVDRFEVSNGAVYLVWGFTGDQE